MKWKIYYNDGTTYCDQDGSPFDAPGRGVQIVAIEDNRVGRILLGKEDNYWWLNDRWYGGDLFGLYDYLQDSGPKKVIFGRVIDMDSFNSIIKIATTDPYLPKKNAKVLGEI